MKNTINNGEQVSGNEKVTLRGWVWDDARAFLAVAHHGTLSGAASELKLGTATLSRKIDRLESALNYRSSYASSPAIS